MSATLQYNGRLIDFNKIEDIVFDVTNILNSAVKVCRFNGHTQWHYSNLQHMYHASELADPEFELAALLHDVHEVAMGDFISPLKGRFSQQVNDEIAELKWELDVLISRQFNCPELLHVRCRNHLHEIDQELTRIEAWTLLKHPERHFEKPTVKFHIPDLEDRNSYVKYIYHYKLTSLIRSRERGEEEN